MMQSDHRETKGTPMGMPTGRGLADHAAPMAGHHPADHGGAVVPPNVDSATYTFPRRGKLTPAQVGELVFGYGYGLPEVINRLDPEGTLEDQLPDVYGRLSNPAVRAVETAMCGIEPDADWAFAFPSGMAGINAIVLACAHKALQDGDEDRDVIVHTSPLYGGTHAVVHNFTPRWGFTNVEIDGRDTDALRRTLEKYGSRVALILCETPANPTLDMVDIRAFRAAIDEVYGDDELRPTLAVDNTFMGIFQHPLSLGADAAFYSASKFLGGHSDMIGGIVVGRNSTHSRIKSFTGDIVTAPLAKAIGAVRTVGGFTTSSAMAQQLWKHMQTYRLRMERQAQVAEVIADHLVTHPSVSRVLYPTLLEGRNREIYENQCLGSGSMIAFVVKPDTKKAAFRFLDRLEYIPAAVSLGFVRTMANHPWAWTHSDLSPEHKMSTGITPGLVRLSVGIEEPDRLIRDIDQALSQV